MLLNDFFEIGNTSLENDTLVVPVNINKNHRIFEGHFPNNPVVPGVCMVQMLTDIINKESDTTLVLSEAKVIKFTQTIVPGTVSDLRFEINQNNSEDSIIVKAELNSDNGNHFKFSGIFKAENLL